METLSFQVGIFVLSPMLWLWWGKSLAKFLYKKPRESGGQLSPWNLKNQIKTPNPGNLKLTSKPHFPNPNNQKKIHYKGNKLNH